MIGVLMMAYGSPTGPEDLEAYYTHIRRGRLPSPEMLAELAGRYEAIGWSPLHEITRRQADALQARLDAIAPRRNRVYVGMKHSQPFIGDTVKAMAAGGIVESVGIVLAPHYSRMSIGTYIEAAETARKNLPTPMVMRYVERWGEDSLFLDALADRLRAALATLPEPERSATPVIFTAHSLPEKILDWRDPYPDELRRTSAAVADRVGVGTWTFAFQSAGRTADPWLGPNVRDVIQDARDAGHRSVAVCSVGFVTDHLEVLYDLDIEARRLAEELGMRFVRAASLNDHPWMIEALAGLVQHHATDPSAGVGAAH
jgi:ferrochelatase